jgi:hypothetical protein
MVGLLAIVAPISGGVKLVKKKKKNRRREN